MSETPTPRTDAELVSDPFHEWVMSSFARTLERELSAADERTKKAEAERDEAKVMAGKWASLFSAQVTLTCSAQQRAEKVEAECDALRADAERYRWLRASREEPWTWLVRDVELDAAIDAARAALKEAK